MLEVPRELAGLRIKSYGGTGEESLVTGFGPATCPHPGFGLRDSPISFVQFGIVTAGDPCFAAGTHHAWNRAPGIRSWLVTAWYRLEFPKLFTAGRVVAADEAAFGPELGATHQSLH